MTTDSTRTTIPEVVARFADYRNRPANGAWGSHYIVLDDGNVRDDDVTFCIDDAIERGDEEGAALGWILLGMSRMQRRRLPDAVEALLRSRTPQQAPGSP